MVAGSAAAERCAAGVYAPVGRDVGVRTPGAVERGGGEVASVLVDVVLHGGVLERRARDVVREPAAGQTRSHYRVASCLSYERSITGVLCAPSGFTLVVPPTDVTN